MPAVDTNLLLRILVRDDARQVQIAEAFIAQGVWVPVLAVAETIWVLGSAYGKSPKELAAAVTMLLSTDNLYLQDAEAITAALELFRARPALGFSDCLMVELARKTGHLPLATFDRALAKVEGTQKL